MKNFLLVLAALLWACGGSSSSEEHAHHDEHSGGEEHHDGSDHGHGDLPQALEDLHQALAPVWHMGEGPERRQAACDQAASFVELASAASASLDGPGSSDHAAALNRTAAELETACANENDDAISNTLHAFHDEFHHSVDFVQGRHDH